jgi:hypothetical protein
MVRSFSAAGRFVEINTVAITITKRNNFIFPLPVFVNSPRPAENI